MWERARVAWKELTPEREPHWLGYSRPSSLACRDRQLGMRRFRTFKRVFKRTMTLYQAGVLYEAFPGLSSTTPSAALMDKRW